MNKVLFIDRDGVINKEKEYVYHPEEFEFIDGVFDALKKFNLLGYLIIIISNQAGIGRGLYTEEDFKNVSEWMLEEFRKHEVIITDIFYDPHHPVYGVGKYKKDSFDRKPNPGMIFKAVKKYDIDLKNSLLVGDKLSDIEAGINAGVETLFLVRTGHSVNEIIIPAGCTVIDALNDIFKFLG
jgi:D-glycero-D-manno-heptose 1,7-bisphosphate phosphatase